MVEFPLDFGKTVDGEISLATAEITKPNLVALLDAIYALSPSLGEVPYNSWGIDKSRLFTWDSNLRANVQEVLDSWGVPASVTSAEGGYKIQTVGASVLVPLDLLQSGTSVDTSR